MSSSLFDLSKIQCVILAGGRGTRLGAITRRTPKPAVKINGRPFILYKIDSLIRYGFRNFLFLVSFESEKLTKIVEDYAKNKNFNFSFLKDQSQAGTLAALVEAEKKLEKIFFYTNADEISLFDIRQMYILFCTQNALVTALVKKDTNGYLTVNQHLINQKKKIGEGKNLFLKKFNFF